MPPHCDAMDGPVVKAAQKALEAGDVRLVLPYVHKPGELEVTRAFDKVMAARKDGTAVRELADLYFFETMVRVHRAGEGAPYTGLKPAGLNVGPIIPIAEKAIETGSVDELIDVLSRFLRGEVQKKFESTMRLKPHAEGPVDEAREYVEAALGLQVYSHRLYQCMMAEPHGEEHKHG